MSLDAAEQLFISELTQIMDAESQEENDAQISRQRIAEKMASAIKKFIKAGKVTVTVNTTGTATAQAGTGTGIIT
ncbi:hypothetical protein SAMN05443633_107151 [Chryseobacterium arachidis]|uniref:Uncharacterized protein n=1 Tax=Chryseobacterium arachidis TaxID=1416778 RepID=A0A1M5F4I2_9FLAO|nr:hypothetical protein [Chryseobacterium arachidis]SHF86002.1 hypothetical protein SAMN05443633_107151 [Chryseobacterium arachidis]